MSVIFVTRQVGDVTVVDASGQITLGKGSKAFREQIKELVAGGHKKILINMGEISHIDGSGIGVLVNGHTTVTNAGGLLKLMNLGKQVYDLLQVTQLYTVFQTFDDEAAAIRSFS